MNPLRIIGIQISERKKDIDELQYTLTKFGNVIRTRIGLNDLNEFDINRRSIVLLELIGDEQEMAKLERALNEIDGLQIRKMDF